MYSHVAGRKMRLSKLLFIALVGLCVVFMRVSAEPGDEVAVEAEGEAVAPGAQAVEGGAEVGETQAAQDVVRSQMATTRGPTRSQTPSKMQKGNKLKIAIVIGLILLLLAVVGTTVGLFVIKPKIIAGREKKLSESLTKGMPDNYKIEKCKMGDDKKERYYIKGPETLTQQQEEARAALYKKMSDADCSKKVGEAYQVKLGSQKLMEDFCKALGKPKPEKETDLAKHVGSVAAELTGGKFVAQFDGNSLLFKEAKAAEKKDDKADGKK